MEVLRLVATGRKNQNVAALRELNEQTVKFHLTNWSSPASVDISSLVWVIGRSGGRSAAASAIQYGGQRLASG